jgi:hypothetical protein
MEAVNSANLKEAVEARCRFYEERVEQLRALISTEGVTVENVVRRRQSELQSLAVDLGVDLSQVAGVRVQLQGAPYYTKMLDDFSWFLKDLLGALRLYSDSERGRYL